MREESDKRLDDFLDDFQKECDNILNEYYSASRLFNEHLDLFDENMRDMIVEYSVLKLFSKWEEFLENIFIRYMMGDKSKNGDAVIRYVNPPNYEYAYRMIKNVSTYPDWTDINKVLINAENFFKDGGAFGILNTLKSEITSLKKVRNAIAHSSKRAREDFEHLVQGQVGYIPDNITPAHFLIDRKKGEKGNNLTNFEYYVDYLKDSAKLLVEYDNSSVI